jgi:hypothetical protein
MWIVIFLHTNWNVKYWTWPYYRLYSKYLVLSFTTISLFKDGVVFIVSPSTQETVQLILPLQELMRSKDILRQETARLIQVDTSSLCGDGGYSFNLPYWKQQSRYMWWWWLDSPARGDSSVNSSTSGGWFWIFNSSAGNSTMKHRLHVLMVASFTLLLCIQEKADNSWT